MDDKDVVELRIKCVDTFVKSASLHDLDKGKIYEYGERLWQFAISALEKPKVSQPTSKR